MKRNLLQCMARVLLLPVALMFICGALVSAHAEYSGPKVRFRLAHPCPPGHHTSLAFEKFAELVAQKSKNKIKVHVFPNAVLGSDVVMLKGALTGGLDGGQLQPEPDLGGAVTHGFRSAVHHKRQVSEELV